jgi:hypothetical protein
MPLRSCWEHGIDACSCSSRFGCLVLVRLGPMWQGCSVLFKSATLQGIRRGEITLAFRRWARPTVKAGTRLRTAIGVLEVEQIEHVESRSVSDGEARQAGFADRAELFKSLRGEGSLYRIALHFVGADPRIALREARVQSDGEAEQIIERLAALDRRARGGPFVQRYLALIDGAPGRVAALLAAEVGLEVLSFKAQVRKLKELGLTESLEVGYRLSPRGRDVLAELAKEGLGRAGEK